jgi:S1-C subfamily serine protease
MKRTLVAGLSGLLLLLLTLANSPLSLWSSAQERGIPQAGSAPIDSLAELSDRLEEVSRRVLPAVVSVEAGAKPVKPGGTSSKETGSGVIVKLEGRPEYFIVTNYHVIKDSPRPHDGRLLTTANITLVLKDGRILRPTRLWSDPETDVAFMTVDGALDLPTAPLGNSDNARIGRLVLAMGNPFGHGWSVSHGIISARDRGQVNLGNATRLKEFLQTDAAINPGSSGGPLIDMRGEVIGITTAIASLSPSNSGVGFCVPINMVKRVMTQLLTTNGPIPRGYLGAQLAEIFEPSEALRLGRTHVNGALVERIYPGSPAEIAGLRPADIILAVDNLPIKSEGQFINLISSMTPGQPIRLQVWRNRTPFTLEARVGDWNKAPEVGDWRSEVRGRK